MVSNQVKNLIILFRSPFNFEVNCCLKFYKSICDYSTESRSQLQDLYVFIHWQRFPFTGIFLELLRKSFAMLFNIAILNHIFILTEFSFKVVDYVQFCERIQQFSNQNFCNLFIFKQSDCHNMGYGIFSCISASTRMVILWTWTKRLKVKCVWLCSYYRFCAD